MRRFKFGMLFRVTVVTAIVLLWIEILVSSTRGTKYRPDEVMNYNDTSEQVLALVPPELHKYLTVRSRINTTGSNATSTDNKVTTNITEILRSIEKYNDAQTILNEDIFGPIQNDSVIIVIQVHTRLTYLRHLVVSLAQAQGIEKTLVIFSHDYYDDDINYLVQSIDFCRVMQIFYPYSIQTHPQEFPGVDPNDCSRDIQFEQAVISKCNNARHPDVYGHYREATYTQTKHHWWWKANRIFHGLHATRDHSGMVVFLEEDHYVAEDFLHMLWLMRQFADKSCPQCHLLCLGTYLKTYEYHPNSNKRRKQMNVGYLKSLRRKMSASHEHKSWAYQIYPHYYGLRQKVEITPWHSSVHNMGMVFNRTVWTDIVSNSGLFCTYDDYNWDYSLLYLSQNRKGGDKYRVLLSKGPRVFHIGECGTHHKKSNCSAVSVISKVQQLLAKVKSEMFPHTLYGQYTTGGVKANKKLTKGNGGWGDIRDHELCINMTRR